MLPSRQQGLSSQYDSLWNTALQQFLRCGVDIDAYLPDKHDDRRRGLTLIARPSAAVCARIATLLQRIAAVSPGQYLYPPESLHLTILALFTATEAYAPYYERLAAYRGAVEAVLADARRFSVTFQGITASPSSIMVQGFPDTGQLNELREALRGALTAAGLAGGLDTRYRITTAHMTVVRFQSQPADMRALLDVLQEYREHAFGATIFDKLALVKNDWYMSPDRVDVVAAYRLRQEA